ncbi:AAA family ATPase [Thalassomonas sp. M1454]|uniref:AAA family ATPase n=1 Tax=Thalassomonas sp. M1454 TaxID=2594477 RepID=UPI001180C3CE|nr:SMC family ATPase [Thalassomonas sp. M1454]TRX57053.1 SMC family ATPase [Thalassomonas sp. M1454]
MKLHKLTIQAFGPFAQTETIDFSKLGDNPLFLIDGPTGAGKSSILHAICYALYGETTDEARKDVGVRCDNAASDLLTELTLEFSIRKQHYIISRIPTQMRQNKRGDGQTEQKASAHLRKILDDGSEQTLVAKKKKDADEQIKQVIGLSAEQFRQVMVLPQGKFRELLLAKSDARQAILSTLFQTEIYKRIEQLLKDKAANIEREYKRFKEQIDEALSEVFQDNVDSLKQSIDEAQKVKTELEQQKIAAGEKSRLSHDKLKSAIELEQAFKAKEQKQQNLTLHLANQEQYLVQTKQIALAQSALKIAPIWQNTQQLNVDAANNKEQLELSLNQHKQAQLKLTDFQAQFELAQQQSAGRDGLVNQYNQLQTYSKVLADFAIIEANAKQAQSVEQKAKQERDTHIEKLSEYQQRCKNGEALIAQLQQQVVNKANMQIAQNTMQTQLTLAQQLVASEQNTAKQQQQVQGFEQNLAKAVKALSNAINSADKLEMLWHSNQAAILAKNLQQDAPCPVCGSIEHPAPAVISSEMQGVSKDRVEHARSEQQVALNQQINADKNLLKATEVLNQFVEQSNKIKVELGELAAVPVEQLQQKLNNLNNELNIILQAEQQIAPAQNKLALMQQDVANREQVINEISDNLPRLSSAYGEAKAKLDNAINTLPEQYRQPQALNNEIAQIQANIKQLDDNLHTAQANYQQQQNIISAGQATTEQLSKVQTELSARLTEQQQLWQHALSSSEFKSDDEFQHALIEQSAIETLVKQVKEFEQTRDTLSSQLALLNEQLKDKQVPNMEELQVQNNADEAAFKQIEQEWASAQTQLSRLTDTQNKITRIEAEQVENKKQYQVIGTLSSAASGRGKVRVSLERFVLGDLLDSVLAIASKRLHIMSKGQYRLVRQDEGLQKKNVTAGLDLAIDDAYTGKTRPVATLSGGESFIASLALALGLSDVVQQRSGGIQLDTLFIDEGFGSLDQESLQLAIETLMDLQASGRTIGVISHVSELKEQMALRIDVKSERSGSSISTIANN